MPCLPGNSENCMRARHTLAHVLGELVQTMAGKWITHPPSRCPNGHPLGPGEVLLGHQACLGHGGGHTTWTCLACDSTVYGPPLNVHCTCFDGPAVVRIPNVPPRVAGRTHSAPQQQINSPPLFRSSIPWTNHASFKSCKRMSSATLTPCSLNRPSRASVTTATSWRASSSASSIDMVMATSRLSFPKGRTDT